MRAKTSGCWTSLLMVVPLAAIPLMAIFGVPELDCLPTTPELVAEDMPPDDFPSFVNGGDRCVLSDRPTSAAASKDGRREDSSLEPFPSDAAVPDVATRSDDWSAAPPPEDAGDPAPNTTWLNGFFTSAQTSPTDSAPAPAPRPRPASLAVCEVPRSSGDASGSESAAQRLAAIGITDYRLEPGFQQDSVVFICQFAPDGDPRILQRFEAEAPDPELAVQQVLAQIESWRQRR